MRNIEMQTGFLRAPSCLISCGNTRVLCAATVSEGVPPFLKGKGQGWLTAEYAMLPASTGGGRKPRDGVKKDGRGVEISRLIGRSLRQAVDMTKLGERTITIDCDVIEADGGTRCASITGGFVALCLAVDRLIAERKLFDSPIVRQVAAVSCGVVAGENALDLCYEQDSRADVDMNVIMDENRSLIEIQGTGEHAVFPRARLSQLLDLAEEGIDALMQAQREALGEAARWIAPKTPRLLFATNNAHKARELKDIMAGKYEVLSLREAGVELDVDETGETFAENALLKAEAV
ncbi:MAG: ribonuclease PH, partial [Candidatus Aphodomonas sp.]|nr:ribonuclease PH [Candidatus Aphodomonas sp.]